MAEGNSAPSAEQIAAQITNTVMQKYGTGSSYQSAAQAVTAALQGLAGGNIAQALTGAAAPYIAEQIKQMTVGNAQANLMAHAVLGAVVAQAQGNSALAGAAGAGLGEFIATQLYPGKKTSELTEEQRQTVSALATLAGGLAGAWVGGDAANAVAGASGAKNAVDNNHLNTVDTVALQMMEREFEVSCKNGAAGSACEGLAKDIADLKGNSILKEETTYVAEDFGHDSKTTATPGELKLVRFRAMVTASSPIAL